MTLGERIRMIRKGIKPKMSQTEFASTLGMSRPAYSMYEIDKVIPPPATKKLICEKYNVNERWLETGEGEPYITFCGDLSQEIQDIMRGEDPIKVAVMTSLAEMPPEWWTAWSEKLYAEIGKQKNGRG